MKRNAETVHTSAKEDATGGYFQCLSAKRSKFVVKCKVFLSARHVGANNFDAAIIFYCAGSGLQVYKKITLYVIF